MSDEVLKQIKREAAKGYNAGQIAAHTKTSKKFVVETCRNRGWVIESNPTRGLNVKSVRATSGVPQFPPPRVRGFSWEA